jgi:hypothetical protein
MDAWHHQLMLERQQQLEEALRRAEEKKATENDWEIIYIECGLRRQNGTHSQRT